MEGRRRTGLGREDVLVIEQILHPGHHIVDVGGRRKLDTFPVLVDPGVIETGNARSMPVQAYGV